MESRGFLETWHWQLESCSVLLSELWAKTCSNKLECLYNPNLFDFICLTPYALASSKVTAQLCQTGVSEQLWSDLNHIEWCSVNILCHFIRLSQLTTCCCKRTQAEMRLNLITEAGAGLSVRPASKCEPDFKFCEQSWPQKPVCWDVCEKVHVHWICCIKY